MIYNAPEVKVLAALANVAATSQDDEPSGPPALVPPCAGI